VPSRKKLKLVKRHCKRKNLRVYECVSNVTLPKTPGNVLVAIDQLGGNRILKININAHQKIRKRAITKI
jgi:hypothetical protein